MSWHFVERWLQKVYQHSTLIGKFWITFLIVFRIVVVSSVSDRVYSDEQSEFRCNTGQVGCGNICFNQFSPMSHIRFWSFQIIMVSTPTILFMVYSAHQVKSTEKKDSKNTKQMREKQRMEERQMRRQSMYPGPGGAVPPGGMDPHGATGAHLRRASAHPNAVPGNPNLMPNLNSPQQEKISNKKSVTSSPETKNGGNKKSVMNAHDHSNPHHHHHHHHHGPPPGLGRKNSIKMGAGGDMGGVLQSAAHSHPPTAQKLSKMADEDKQSFMNHFLLYTVSVVMRTIIELLFMCLQWYFWRVLKYILLFLTSKKLLFSIHISKPYSSRLRLESSHPLQMRRPPLPKYRRLLRLTSLGKNDFTLVHVWRSCNINGNEFD